MTAPEPSREPGQGEWPSPGREPRPGEWRSPAPAYSLDSVDNALRLVQALDERGRLRVSEAAELLGIARSTAHRLLATLKFRGFAAQDGPDRTYTPGPALADAGLRAIARLDLRQVAHPHLQALAQEVGETVHLVRLEGNGARFLDGVESPQVVRVGLRTGLVLPAHATAAGKAILAALPPDQVRALYPRGLQTLTGATLQTLDDVERHLQEVARAGYATNYGESAEGVAALGVVVRDQVGQPVGAVAVAAPAERHAGRPGPVRRQPHAPGGPCDQRRLPAHRRTGLAEPPAATAGPTHPPGDRAQCTRRDVVLSARAATSSAAPARRVGPARERDRRLSRRRRSPDSSAPTGSTVIEAGGAGSRSSRGRSISRVSGSGAVTIAARPAAAGIRSVQVERLGREHPHLRGRVVALAVGDRERRERADEPDLVVLLGRRGVGLGRGDELRRRTRPPRSPSRVAPGSPFVQKERTGFCTYSASPGRAVMNVACGFTQCASKSSKERSGRRCRSAMRFLSMPPPPRRPRAAGAATSRAAASPARVPVMWAGARPPA